VTVHGSSPRKFFCIIRIGRCFTPPDPEWKSLVIFGLYTGQRLGDLARLTFDALDLQRNELRLRTGKDQPVPGDPAGPAVTATHREGYDTHERGV
jgi:integrase